ncbi:MAG: TIGR01777 family oxidoreductase [Gemmatimonadaceae bacterium]|nr:TIGR01777 family oxidoreductase [Gemmatimonadaceae bacterium]
MPTFSRTLRVPVPAAELFAWHERPGAFERLNPPWQPVQVTHRSGGIRDGARVVLRVPIAGPIGIPWELTHRDYIAGVQFRDEQVRGPFARWSHLHAIAPDGAGASILTDTIDFAAPFPLLGGALVDAVLVAELDRLFRYRHAVTAGDLQRHAAYPGAPLRVAISGATGLIGSALDAFLTTGGHRVHRIVRGAPDPTRPDADIRWDPARGTIDAHALEGVDAVIHLAGASVAERWSDAHRAEILTSRVRSTELLARTIAGLTRKPAVFISSSAVGIYGNRGDESLDETSLAGAGYLADVGRAWESAAESARAAGVRVVHPRTGIVLAAAGGALAKLVPIYQIGGGGPIGQGRAYQPWMALDDWLGALLHVLRTPTVHGPVNFTGPAPVPQREFAKTLGAVLRRPAIAPVPPMALAAMFGREMANEVLLSSQRAYPRALEASGFVFRHATLADALRFELGRPD